MGIVDGETEVRADDRDSAIEALHNAHYTPLVRLVTLMVGDLHLAEEIVQDGFLKVYAGWHRIRDPDRRISYLRSAVLNGARNRLARTRVADRFVPFWSPPEDTTAARVLATDRERALVAELRKLPRRQRECVALRFYLDLYESEIAETLGISPGSVKTHTHRALQTLAERVEQP